MKKPKTKPEFSKNQMTVGLIDCMESNQYHQIQCCICSSCSSATDVSQTEYARKLLQEGWKYQSSDKFQTIGVMCPKCAKLPDSERKRR